MKTQNLSEFSDQNLLKLEKKLKNEKLLDATLIGLTIGVFLYSLVKNGLGFSTFFPLVIGYLFVKNSNNNNILEEEVKKEALSRNLH